MQTVTMSTKSSKSYKYEVKGKKARDTLNQEEQELFDLCHLAGIEISPAVLRIILDLLKLNVSPLTIAEMLKSMIHQGRLAEAGSSGSRAGSRPSSRKGDKSSRGEPSTSRDKDRHRHERAGKTSGSHKTSGHT